MNRPTLNEIADHILDSIPYTDFEDEETGELRDRPDTVDHTSVVAGQRVIDVVELPEGARFRYEGVPFLRITVRVLDVPTA